MFTKDMFIQYVTALLRTLLAPVTIYLSQNGYLTDNQVAQLLIIIASIVVTVVWSLGNKYIWGERVEIARQAQPNTDPGTLKDILKGKV